MNVLLNDGATVFLGALIEGCSRQLWSPIDVFYPLIPISCAARHSVGQSAFSQFAKHRWNERNETEKISIAQIYRFVDAVVDIVGFWPCINPTRTLPQPMRMCECAFRVSRSFCFIFALASASAPRFPPPRTRSIGFEASRLHRWHRRRAADGAGARGRGSEHEWWCSWKYVVLCIRFRKRWIATKTYATAQ